MVARIFKEYSISGDPAFEKTHERITLWIDKSLKARFEALADEEGISN